ncbi:MAG: tRNA uridine-5-carboxymethylaminomethyl(34) synthesis GTPase MnmE [Tenericutes bacterium]|nr:tRNA uridine-5-carboxymethylaminomethyl(34) synthesis GTPase MnmE [Mycoplasmatota bacterium]
MEETIAAIATPLGVGAISIIRVSGSNAIDIVNKIFKGKDLTTVPSHTIHYGHIVDKDQMIDEVLLSVMRAPKTYTREDIVEINSHGGIATTNKVLQLLLENGCVPASPGEFTKRAFLNGRIDLEEAEGIMNLIEAKTEPARKLSINQLSGNVSKKIQSLRDDIVKILANIEVNIDYPEYEDIEEMTYEMLTPKIAEIKEKVLKILEDSKSGKIITEGIKTSIIGKPNVGKSSILNTLLGEEKAIVTEIEGTTRDIVEGKINIGGFILNMIDTAGIRKTEDIVEKIGVNKSLQLISNSDLILYVLNNNQPLTEEDLELLKKVQNKNYIIILNKTDLESKIDLSKLPEDHIVKMSIKNKEGINELKEKIKEIFNLEKIETSDMTFVTSARSLAILNQIRDSIEDIEKGLKSGLPIDIIEIDIKNIWDKLGEIIGVSYETELIDTLFSQFCLGK